MSVATVCMSHSPLLGSAEAPDDVVQEVEGVLARARDFVADFDPTLVVLFAPDHYNGFFYGLMPPFCVGYRAEGVGDYGSQAGPLDVPEATAERLAQHVLDREIDMAISRRMLIDHGAVQPLEVLLGDVAARPVLPIFVNGVAAPFTAMRRIRRMGAAVGEFVAGLADERVLLIGSGGLSHDPPLPQWTKASPEQQERLLSRQPPSVTARSEREQRVVTAARDFANGNSPMLDLNPDWDRAFISVLESGDLTEIDTYEPFEMAAEAGNSAHEVRTWVAAFSALQASGGYHVISSYYRPIREYIAGFGVVTATTATSGRQFVP